MPDKKEYDPVFEPMIDSPSTRAQMKVEKVVSQVIMGYAMPAKIADIKSGNKQWKLNITFNGQPFTWFMGEFVQEMIVKTGASKGDLLDVWVTQEMKPGAKKKSRVWNITRTVIGPEVQAPLKTTSTATTGDPGPQEPPDVAVRPPEQKVHHVEGPKPLSPGPGAQRNGNGKRGWTRESIAEQVEWWCNQCAEVITEYEKAKVPMPAGEICKFHNTGLIQSLKLGPPREIEPEPEKKSEAADAPADKNRTIGDLTVEEKQQYEVEKLTDALALFITHRAGEQFQEVLEKFQATCIEGIQVSAIGNFQKALKVAFESIKAGEGI